MSVTNGDGIEQWLMYWRVVGPAQLAPGIDLKLSVLSCGKGFAIEIKLLSEIEESCFSSFVRFKAGGVF